MRRTVTPTTEQLLSIAANAERRGDVYEIRSTNSEAVYYTTAQFCSCPSFKHRGGPCKHQLSIELLCPPVALPKKFEGDPFEGFL